MLFERLTPDFSHCDDRGILHQLVHEDCEQVNVLITHADVVRGGHYHKESTETFYVVTGSVNLLFERDGQRA